MKELRRLAIHAILLVVAAGFAYRQSLPDDPSAVPPKPGEVELWAHGPSDITRIELLDERQKVVLERKSDERGTFYRGQVEPTESGKVEEPDAGPHARRPVEPATFISVEKGDETAKKLAPLRAKRLVGEVGPDREPAFGLDKSEGVLAVEIAGTRHELVLGGPTPGAGDRYARYKKDNLVYVIDGTVVRNMQGGAPLLAERQQHAFKMADVEKATVQAGESRKTLVRGGTTGRRFWANVDSPETNDETAGNWLGKLDNLRPVTFVESLPAGASRVARVDYEGPKGLAGFTELHLAREGDDTYYIVTETLRMPATVSKAVAAQVRDDVAVLFGLAPPREEGAREPSHDESHESHELPEGHPPMPPRPPEGPPPGAPTPPSPEAPKGP